MARIVDEKRNLYQKHELLHVREPGQFLPKSGDNFKGPFLNNTNIIEDFSKFKYIY